MTKQSTRLRSAEKRGFGTFYEWDFNVKVYLSFNKSFGASRDIMMVHDREVDARVGELLRGFVGGLETLENVVVRVSQK